EEAPRRAARPGGHGRRRAGSGRDRERASGGCPRGPRRPRARAAGGGVPSDQRAPARGHDRLAEVGACGVRARPRRGDVEGQARDRWLRRRSGAADHPQRDGLHGLHGRGRGVPDPPPPQQSRADPPDGRGRPRARAAVVSHHAPPHGLPGAHDPPRAMTDRAPGFALPPDVEPELEGVAPCEIAIGVLTYNNAETVPAVAKVVRAGLERHFAGARAVLINADAGSTDGTPDLLAAAGLPLVRARHATPLAQRVAVPFHGVPARGAALRLTFAVARRLGARGLGLLEADVTSAADEWLERLLRPVLEQKADLVVPVYARHRYDGTITNLVLAPLVRALFGRRLHQPLAGGRATLCRHGRIRRPVARHPWQRAGPHRGRAGAVVCGARGARRGPHGGRVPARPAGSRHDLGAHPGTRDARRRPEPRRGQRGAVPVPGRAVGAGGLRLRARPPLQRRLS